MIRNIIKYVGIALVIVGILLVMKNLIIKESNQEFEKNSSQKKYYSATIKLLDKDTGAYLKGAKLILKNKNNELIAEWTTNDNSHTINKLEKGTYILLEQTAPENYHLNEDTITFEIKNKDKDIAMYNTKMTSEEIKAANTTNTEVNVDNTASNKNIMISLLSIIITTIGISIIYKTKKTY